MKGSGKILSGIACLTVLLLFYVHLQISSVIVSFDLHRSSQALEEKQEVLRRLQFNVGQLKAPQLLEEKMKKHDLALGLPNKVQVLDVPSVPDFSRIATQDAAVDSSVGSSFSSIFGRLIQTAQAKTDLPS
ncbi:MAG: hypothetical protein BWY42_00736 [Candidatus Omnitrophica bacterium ADurb.Bin277]|nr:MAG: hypothetical protein BWY42_00736 [Candidatus Omnitrophica bacterium ADurb.Bin277]